MSSFTCHCKYCDKRYHLESKIFPSDLLGAWLGFWVAFHVIFHHPKEVNLRKVWGTIKQICYTVFLTVVFFLLSAVRLVLYPLYWILDNFVY